jgi:hypothetical protein
MLFDVPNLRRDANAQLTRQVKTWVAEVLHTDEETAVLVTEMRCTTPDCPPVKTVIALMQPEQPIRQYKIHKPLQDITLDDVTQLITVQPKFVQAASASDDKEAAE